MSNLLQFAPAPTGINDTTERAQALDITRSFIVEAPAGSGKTGLLIQRLLKLLASDNVTDPAQVLAITFTRKATHEMRDRVMQQLAGARLGHPPSGDFDLDTRPMAEAALARDQRLGWGLLEHPNRLNISTIDAFCIQIANSLPVLSGAGGQSPVEDSSELHADAARRTLNLLGGDDPALTSALEALLLHRDGDLADCEKLIADMLNWRDQWGNLIPLSNDQLTDHYLETVTLPRLEKALDQAICRALTQLDKLMPPALCHELALLARKMSQAAGYNGAESPLAICRELTSAPGTAAADLDHWRVLAHTAIAPSSQSWRKPTGITGRNIKFDISKQDKAELVALIESLSETDGLCEALCALTNLPPVKYPQEQWQVAKALFRVLSRALVELQFVFEARGECDFTQFSLIAREALRRDGVLDDYAASTGFNLEHLLVDEMQDTSSGQYELIRLLTQRWDGGSQTVFLVGDPKQSIYLFRQARVARFIDTLRAARLGDLPLTPLFLAANFRSQGNLVGAFNGTFSRIFPTSLDDASSEAVPYRIASAVRPGSDGLHIEWHATALPYSADKAVCAEARITQRTTNAAKIRALIEAWRARPLPANRTKPWTIAVLVRGRKHLLPIVRAFKEGVPIPFRAVKTEPLAERQEVLDLLSLTRALLHPADRTAWLALLRTPWCGLTLRDLHLLAGRDDDSWSTYTILSLIAERGDLLSDDGVARLEPFWNVLSAALAQRGQLPLSQWVARTWRAFGAERFASADELANVERFFQLLDEIESSGPPGIAQLSQRIARLYAAESTQPDAVDLMTIHNAKGLEWDFVIVPELESSSGKSSSRLLSWLEIEAGHDSDADPDVAHGIIAPVQSKGTESQALNKWMRSIDSAREAAERKRLFYVACTRAREELHLFAAPDRKKDGDISRKFDSLLAAAWSAAKPYFEDEPTETPGFLEDLAAAAGLALVPPPFSPAPERTLQRIPLEAFPQSSRSQATAAPSESFVPFERPDGGFEARAFGNATHAFLELLATRLASGVTTPALLAELPTWTPRISTVLRASGLAPEEIARAASSILRGLTRTLEDPDGQWVLAAHPEAATESSLVSASGIIRLDRTFLAGATPHDKASTHLWIVDFKTGTHGAEGLEAFLAREREKYAPQLETYGAHLAPRGILIRLALFYPMLPKLIWWPFES